MGEERVRERIKQRVMAEGAVEKALMIQSRVDGMLRAYNRRRDIRSATIRADEGIWAK
jgi:hypothetical protein